MTKYRSIAIAVVAAAAGATALLAGAPASAQFPNTGSIDPTSGPIGTTVNITGEALQCDTVQMISFVVVRGNEVAPVSLTWEGDTFSGSVVIPAEYQDARTGGTAPMDPGTVVTFELNCPSGPVVLDFTVTAPPTTTVPATTTTTTTAPPFVPPAEPPADAGDFTGPLPGSVPPGGTFTIDEGGFEPGEDVVIVLYSDPKVLASVKADSTGRVLIAVALPADTVPGAHTVVLFSRSKVIKAPITVSALPGQAPADTLPRTGSGGGSAGSAGLGLALVAAGLGTVALSRRRAARA